MYDAPGVGLKASAAAMVNSHDSQHALIAFVTDYEELEFEPAWSLVEGGMRGAEYYRSYQAGSAEIDVSGPLEWQNPVFAVDVDSSGSVSPRDALLIINELSFRRFSAHDGELIYKGFAHNHHSLEWESFSYLDTSGLSLIHI